MTDTSSSTGVEPDSPETDETASGGVQVPETPQNGAEGDSVEAVTAEAPETSPDDVEDQDDAAGGKGNKEAARYRRRLRETEQERDTLKATVEALQRAEVDRLAESDGLRPAALWSGAELGDL